MTRLPILALTAGILAAAGTAHAAPDKAAELSGAVRNVDSAPSGRPFSGLSGFEISAGQDDSSVSLKGSRVDSWGPSSIADFSALTVTVSAPLAKGGKPSDVASLDGFADSTSLQLDWLGVHIAGAKSPDGKLQDAVCQRVRARLNPLPKDAPDPGHPCYAFVLKYGAPQDVEEFKSGDWEAGAIAWIGGVTGKVGYNKYEFTDTTTLAAASAHRTPWSVGANFGVYPRSLNTLFMASYSHQESYDDADSRTVCPGGAAPVTCASGPFGGPKMTRRELATLEVRHRFETWAFAPALTWDTRSGVWAAEIPVYFIQTDKQDGFSGGVKFGWRSDDHDFRAAVFVGKAFSALTF